MKKEKLLVITFIILTIVLLQPKKMWDEYVYILNARTFAGDYVYFEDIRPPLLPLIMSPFYALGIESIAFVVPILFFIGLIIVFYLFVKKLKINSYVPLIILLSFPVILEYSKKYMTSMPATFFLLMSLLLLHKYTTSKKPINLYFSFFSASLSTLTRYPMGLTYVVVLILYYLFVKRKVIKHLLISQFFFFIPILIWIFYIGFESFYYAFVWGSGVSSPLFYLISLPLIFGISIIFIPFLLKYRYKKEDLWFLVPLIIFMFFFQIFSNKEIRFLIPILPFLSLMLFKSIKINKNFLLIIVSIFFIVSLISTIINFSIICDDSFEMEELKEFFSDKQGITILSNVWPVHSYYTNNICYATVNPFRLLNQTIEYRNISYVVISNENEYFTNYSMVKLINGTCNQIGIYLVSEQPWSH